MNNLRAHRLPPSTTGYRHLWLFLLPLLAAPALAPLYMEGLPRSYDGGYHMLRLAVLDRGVATGTFLLRWAPEMLLGFGYPAFNFSVSEVRVPPGDTVTLTLYYRSVAPTTADLTRFVHLYTPATGMIAQHDSRPTESLNPTWAWQPGEVIVDRVALTIDAGAAPGSARLLLDFYDVAAGATRIPAFDAAGGPLPDAVIPLTKVEIAP